MPLPTPHKDQEQQDFINSCLSSEMMRREYPDQRQRAAVCFSQYRRAKHKKGKADWNETVAAIEHAGIIQTDDEVRILRLGKAADKEPYGDVEYADPGYQKDGQKRYPIDTEEHVRAAWSYINQEKNASQYTSEQVKHIKGRIVAAWKRLIDPAGPPGADKD